MGLKERAADLYQRANGSFGRHGIVWALALFVLPFVSLGAFAGYLATTASWYWRHFGWLGVWIAVLLTWVLLGAALLVVRHLFDPAWLRQVPVVATNTPIQDAIPAPAQDAPKRAGWIKKSVNWNPWKWRTQYNISDFSRILTGIDPNGTASNESEAFKDLLIEEANAGRLKSNRRRDQYTRTYNLASWETEIAKSDAIEWAKSKGIDVSHIE